MWKTVRKSVPSIGIRKKGRGPGAFGPSRAIHPWLRQQRSNRLLEQEQRSRLHHSCASLLLSVFSAFITVRSCCHCQSPSADTWVIVLHVRLRLTPSILSYTLLKVPKCLPATDVAERNCNTSRNPDQIPWSWSWFYLMMHFCPFSPLLPFCPLLSSWLSPSFLHCIRSVSSALIFSRCRRWSKWILLFSAVCLCKTSVSVRASRREASRAQL